MNILIKLINDVKALCNTVITAVNAIKAKTDTITASVITQAQANNLDATISSRQANAGLTTTHASRIDASISSRASQASVDAIKAKTELPLAVINPIVKLPAQVTTNTEYTVTLLTTTSSQEVETCFISFETSLNNTNYSATFEVLEGSNVVDFFYQKFSSSISYPIKLKLGKSSTLRVRTFISASGSNAHHGFICSFRRYTI